MLILASTSQYRQEILSRLNVPFQIVAPRCEENIYAKESAADMALRLARMKARSISDSYQNDLIIGSDQVADLNGRILGKPMRQSTALDMLMSMSGKKIAFYTAVVLVNTYSGNIQDYVDCTYVSMRSFSEKQAYSYLVQEPEALWCAGAAKSEGLGGALIQYIDSCDPNGLIGLPLFALVTMLANEGIEIL